MLKKFNLIKRGNRMKTIYYYHNDADGVLSAALVNHFVGGEADSLKQKSISD